MNEGRSSLVKNYYYVTSMSILRYLISVTIMRKGGHDRRKEGRRLSTTAERMIGIYQMTEMKHAGRRKREREAEGGREVITFHKLRKNHPFDQHFLMIVVVKRCEYHLELGSNPYFVLFY